MSNPKANYSLTLTEKQLQVIQSACELLFRIKMGQLSHVAEFFFHRPINDILALREGLDKLSTLATGLDSHSASHGISSPEISDDARIAADVHDVIRHHLSWKKNPKGGWTVNFDKPRGRSDTERLPELVDRRDFLK